ncbi:hypothetical protein B6U93_01340 [Candidatus Woesearchaeota archaeon ex4484_78]|nr:MAG: hypothetical protein B6U93_01340 [Candidatus Woesearchaeota archaeon ex4484_78]
MRKNPLLLFIATLLAIPIAFADAGIAPLIYLNIRLLPLVLVPIIFIEAFVIKKFLKTSYGKSLLYSGIVNIVSTIAGYLVLSILIIVILAVIHIIVANPISRNIFSASFFQSGGFYIAILFLGLIFSFLITILLEYLILRAFFKKKSKKIVIKTALIANIISYIFLVIVIFFLSQVFLFKKLPL